MANGYIEWCTLCGAIRSTHSVADEMLDTVPWQKPTLEDK